MSPGERSSGRPHVFAACIAFGVTVVALVAGRAVAIEREHSTVVALAPEVSRFKTQGLALQRAAATAPNVLPLYGSSEMLAPDDWRAPDFFRNAPTGFQVSAVGKAGASSLILLPKIAALDRELRGRKVAVSLSSLWFFGAPQPYWYEGNFSRFAVSQLVFDSALSFRLKRDVAARMIQYPRSFESTPLLGTAVRSLAAGDWISGTVFWALWPLGKLQDTIWDLQDHFAALTQLRGRAPGPPLRAQTLDWRTLVAQADVAATKDPRRDPDDERPAQTAPGSRDDWFRQRVSEAVGWTDLELLLRVLRQIDARPLLLAMPMNGPYFTARGVSRAARQCYYDKLHDLAHRYRAHLVDFADHDEDPNFLNPHLTAKGWILFNRAIDDFMHDRLPPA